MIDTTLGQRIAEGRKKLGLSQEAFGDRLGVSRQAASKWESDAAVPEIDKLITMSKIFGVSIGWLLGVEAPEAPAETTLSEEQLSAVTELLCRYPTPCPERKNRKWLMAACAAGLTISLVVGTLGLFMPQSKPVAPSDTPALQSQIDELTVHNTELQQQIEALTATLAGATGEQTLSQEKLTELQKELSKLKLELDAQDTPDAPQNSNALPEPVFPGTDLLDSWSLSPKIDPKKDSATLRFSGFTDLDAAEARLIAVLGGYEMASTVCLRTTVGYSGELELPRVNGYTYYFEMTDASGVTQRTELTGHGLSDLATDHQAPTLSFSTRNGQAVQNGTRTFWLSAPSISLGAPDRIPESLPLQWSNLRLVYYCDGTATAQNDLSDELSGKSLSNRSLNFTLKTVVFDLASLTEGSRHNLRLEGVLTANGQHWNFSVSAGDWIMQNGKLVDASETE